MAKKKSDHSVGGDQIAVGNIEGSVAAIGAGAQVIYHNVERALTSVEIDQQAEALERKRLAEAVTTYIQRLQRQAEQAREDVGERSPYKSLLEYDISDTALFYGRTSAIRELLDRLHRGPLTVLHSESGAGKTSLLKAGIMPRLLAAGDVPLYVRPYKTPGHFAIKRALLPQMEQTPGLGAASLLDFMRQVTDLLGGQQVVVILDQFEEIFTIQSPEARDDFVAELAPCLEDTLLPVRWLIAVRDEWFGQLGSFRPEIEQPYANEYMLLQLSKQEATAIIVEPARQRGVSYEAGLVERLVTDLGEHDIAPPQLQLVCSALYDNLHGGKEITLGLYQSLGETTGILGSHLDRVLEREVPPEYREAARRLLEALITSDGRRARRTVDELARDLAALGVERVAVDETLKLMVASRLLRVEEIGEEKQELAYELCHDYLLQQIALDPSAQARKAAQELLAREVESYQKFHTLLSADKLLIIEAQLDTLVPDETEQRLIKDSERALSRQRQRVVVGVGFVILMVILAIASVVLLVGANATRDQALAERSTAQAESTLAAYLQATLGVQAATAQADAANAQDASNLATARELAARAILLIQQGSDPVEAYQLALRAYRLAPNTDSARALYTVVSESLPAATFNPGGARVANISLTGDGNRLFALQTDSTLAVWDIDSRAVIASVPQTSGFYYYTLTPGPDGASALVYDYFSSAARIVNVASLQEIATLGGEGGPLISQPVFSPDGQQVMAVALDGSLYVWEASTGGEIAHLFEGVLPVSESGAWLAFSFSPDVGRLAIIDLDGVLHVWDTATGGELFTTAGQGFVLNNVAFSPDGQYLMTTTQDGVYLIRSAGGGEILFTIYPGTDSYPIAFSFSPDGQRGLVVYSYGAAEIVDMSGTSLLPLFLSSDSITGGGFSPDGDHVALLGQSGRVSIRDVRTGATLLEIGNRLDPILTVLFRPGRDEVVTLTRGGKARLWEIGAAGQLAFVESPSTPIFSPDGSLMSADLFASGTSQVWNLATGEVFPSLDGRITALHSDGQRGVIVTPEGGARIVNVVSGETLAELPLAGESALAAAFTPDGRWLILYTTTSITVRDAATGAIADQFTPVIQNSASAFFSPDGQYLVIISAEGVPEIWSLESGERVASLNTNGFPSSIALNNDSTRALTLSYETNLLQLWDVASGQEVASLTRENETINSAMLSPDGSKVVLLTSRGGARLIDLNSGEELLSFGGLTGEIIAAGFSPDGGTLLTANGEGQVELRDISSGVVISSFGGEADRLFAGSFSPDGRYLVLSGESDVVRVLLTDWGTLAQIVEGRLARLGITVDVSTGR